MIYAILTLAALCGNEVEAPCPALSSPRHAVLMQQAQAHAAEMARDCRQSHVGFERRAAIIREVTGCSDVREICAESWPEQKDCSEAELWREFVKCWRQSPGHWSVASRRHKYIGAAMAQGKNGIWYGCIISAD